MVTKPEKEATWRSICQRWEGGIGRRTQRNDYHTGEGDGVEEHLSAVGGELKGGHSGMVTTPEKETAWRSICQRCAGGVGRRTQRNDYHTGKEGGAEKHLSAMGGGSWKADTAKWLPHHNGEGGVVEKHLSATEGGCWNADTSK